MIECIFGWGEQHGTMRKTKHRGIARVGADFMLNLIAYNLIRIPKLVALWGGVCAEVGDFGSDRAKCRKALATL